MQKTQFHPTFTATLGSLAALLLTGCFDTKQDFTINPDGSGKVVHECAFQKVDLSDDADTSPAALKDAIRKVIEGAKGVDAWRDVSYKRLDDGRLFFRGTAYFKNLSQLDVPNQATMELAWTKLGDGKAMLTVRTNKSSETGPLNLKPTPAKKVPTTPEELQQRLTEERAKFQQMKPMLAAIVGGMKQDLAIRLPGQITETSNFQKDPAGALKIQFDGGKVIEAMEKLLTNNAWMAKRIQAGTTDPTGLVELDDELNGLLFGKATPVRAMVTGATKPLFDYAAEVAVAQKDFAKIMTDLGSGSVTIAPPADGQPLKSVRVVGVRIVSELDKATKLRPFNYDAGYTVAVLAELPGSILSVTDETDVQTALADDGSSLLPEKQWSRKIHFPNLSADKRQALFEIQLKLPGPHVKGIKELSGKLQYAVASGTREVDLGFEALKAKNTGKELGARIESIGEGWQKDGSQQMELKLSIRPDTLKNAWLVLGGNRTALERRGYSGGGNTYTFNLESKQPFPAEGRLVVELFDQVKVFDVPWKLENLNLLGQTP